MAVVVNLDPPRRIVEVKQFGELAAKLRLRTALGQPPVEFLAGIAHRLFEQAAAIAALRHADLDLAVRALPQGFGQQRAFFGLTIDERSEARRVGKEGVRTCRTRWSR